MGGVFKGYGKALGGLDPNYGSDKAGMVCGYAFTPSRGGVPIGPDAAAAWLANPEAEDGFLWLHFNLSNSASTRWLDQHLTLPEGFPDALRANTSTRVELVDGTRHEYTAVFRGQRVATGSYGSALGKELNSRNSRSRGPKPESRITIT